MDNLLKGQFELWMSSGQLETGEEIVRCGKALYGLISCRPDDLELEAKMNEYLSLIAERAFCAGLAWAEHIRAQAAGFLTETAQP